MNDVAMIERGEVVVTDPFDPSVHYSARDVQTMIKAAVARADGRKRQMDELGELGDAPIDAVRELRKAIEADDAALKNFDGNVKAALLHLAGFDSYIVQTKGCGSRIDPLSVRGRFAAMIDALKAVEDAAKPKAPVHSYVMRLTCTDKVLDGLIKKAVKDGAEGVMVASPQTDAAVATIQQWFSENV